MKTEFDDFMQDTYDEEELQYMDSGFVNALRLAFNQGWQASRQSLVVKLPAAYTIESAWIDALEVDSNEQYLSVDSVKEELNAAGVRYE